MPTMKEIAEWLRQAGRDAEQTMPFANEPWEEMAKQVEQTRCETCEWFGEWDNYEHAHPCNRMRERSDDDSIECEITWCGPNFCCIHHKFKEVENG